MTDPLNSYLFAPTSEVPEISETQLKEHLSYINSSLAASGSSETGNLFLPSLQEIKKTTDCIYSLLQQKQKDLNMKVEFQDRMQKLIFERNQLSQKFEDLQGSKASVESENGKLQNKFKQELEKWKKEREKLTSERDDLKKECNKLIGRETQIWHELKKKETLIEKMKEQLRKALGEKEFLYMNHIDLVEPLHREGPQMFGQTGEGEFNFLLTSGYESNQEALLVENQELRSAFEILQRELHNIIKERRAALTTKNSELDMIEIEPDIFNMPFQSVSEDVVKTFQENLRRFKIFIEMSYS